MFNERTYQNLASGIGFAIALTIGALACDRPKAEDADKTAASAASATSSASKHREAGDAGPPRLPFQDPTLAPQERARDLVGRLKADEKIAQLGHEAPAIERLGVPAYSWWNEALHGVARNGRATVFPQAIGLAATFDTELVHDVASAIADEARAKHAASTKLGNYGRYTGLTFWSPNVNIFRDPRWGRGQETYGEDPYLTSRLGVAFVKGLQGDHPQILKTAGCAKHFAVHSGPEALRHEFDARPSRQDLYETYLPAFEALVKEADVECVMSAYNRVFGEPASGSSWLLQDLLRKQWKFDGYIVSDCWALVDFHEHHRVTRSSAESAALALRSGVNLDCGETFPDLTQALEDKRITEQQIDDALVALFRTRMRLGLFDPSTPFDGIGPEVVGSERHAALARRAAARSIVLLKNDRQALPLSKKIKRLSVLGPYGADGYVLFGNYFGVSARFTTLLEGLTAAVDAGTTLQYESAFLPDRTNLNPTDWTTDSARTFDAVIVTLGLSGLIEGEEGAAIASPYKGDRKSLELPPNQIAYLKKLRAAGDATIVAVVFAGSAVDLREVAEAADAILLAWYPGQEGGAALADVIFGDVAPSGRLPLTFPQSLDQLPAFSDYSMQGRGYRFADEEPQYPFGFGLSYGRVEYLKLELSAATLPANTPLQATVTIRNPTQRTLTEVVQLYISDLEASVRVPQSKLVAFRRVELAPGKTRKVKIEVEAEALALVDEEGKRRVEPGSFRLTVGGASPGARAQHLGSPRPVVREFVVPDASGK